MVKGLLLLNAAAGRPICASLQEVASHLDFLQLLLVVCVHLLKALLQLMVPIQQCFAKLCCQM